MNQIHTSIKNDDRDMSEILKDYLQVLNMATDTIRTPKMYIKCIQCIRWYMSLIILEQGDEYRKERFLFIKPISSFLTFLFRKLDDNQIVNSQILYERAVFLIGKGKPDEAVSILSNINVKGEISNMDSLWIMLADIRTRLEMREI